MTATTYEMAFQTTATGRARPRGFDRFVQRVGLALQLWARRRAERGAPNHDERMRALAVERELRERDSRLGRYGILG